MSEVVGGVASSMILGIYRSLFEAIGSLNKVYTHALYLSKAYIITKSVHVTQIYEIIESFGIKSTPILLTFLL
jgi:hypothetical protein